MFACHPTQAEFCNRIARHRQRHRSFFMRNSRSNVQFSVLYLSGEPSRTSGRQEEVQHKAAQLFSFNVSLYVALFVCARTRRLARVQGLRESSGTSGCFLRLLLMKTKPFWLNGSGR